MILPFRKKMEGFSIVEVVVSAVIFAIATAGIISMITFVRPNAVHSEHNIEASYIAKRYLAWLRGKVDATTWATGNLVPGTYTDQVWGHNILYNVTYVITNDVLTGGRLVNLNIDWAEPF